MLDFKIVKNPLTQQLYLETSLSGKALLTIPQLNKGTAFTESERHEFNLLGKLPIHVETLSQQVERAYLQYQSYQTPLQKNTYLNALMNKNQVLFYALVSQHTAEMLSIIYTPTVAEAVEKFSREFAEARGLYISYNDRHRIDEILENRSHPEVDIIVVSDGGGVLGIGDQGVGAMLIPVAKLMVYTICGGIDPLRTLPILLDVGTDNSSLYEDPFYLGWRHPRIRGQEYYDFIDDFVSALKRKFPKVFLHWEDFGRDHARTILQRYRNELCTFNDDIQGTGAVTLAALLAAAKAINKPFTELKIVIFGGGTAGTGIADQLYAAKIRMGSTEQHAKANFWMIDKQGLLLDTMENVTAEQQPYARNANEIEHWQVRNNQNISLLEVIENVKPDVLIGCSTVNGAFNETVVKTMCRYQQRPIIFPLSNPTNKAEAHPCDLLRWSNGKALIATGSPFPPYKYNNHEVHFAQCNNALVFPGIGLGVIAAKATRVTDNMIWAACTALSEYAPINEDPLAPLLPPIDNAKQAAREIATAVAKQAIVDEVSEDEKLINNQNNIEAKRSNIYNLVDQYLWEPHYLMFHRRIT